MARLYATLIPGDTLQCLINVPRSGQEKIMSRVKMFDLRVKSWQKWFYNIHIVKRYCKSSWIEKSARRYDHCCILWWQNVNVQSFLKHPCFFLSVFFCDYDSSIMSVFTNHWPLFKLLPLVYWFLEIFDQRLFKCQPLPKKLVSQK